MLRFDFWYDVRHAIRSLRRTPSFTSVALLTLVLGIGANSAIFSVINAVLLRPLPFRDADRVVFVWSSTSSSPREPLTPGRLKDFREQITSLPALAGISHLSVNLTGNGDPERVLASSVSSAFFDVLGVRPLLGDTFHAGAAGERDVVLGYGLWTRRFGSDRAIVGRDITINGTGRHVVAVMPPEFEWPAITASGSSLAGAPALWIPANRQDIPRTPADDPNEDLQGQRSPSYLRAVGRVREGFTIGQVQREAEMVAERLAATYPLEDAGRGAAVQPLGDQLFGNVRQPLLILLGAVVFVLTIACANAASLLLGRSVARRREIAVRLALGAGRRRVVRQLLIESLVLALAGAAGGLLIAWWGSAWLVAAAPAGTLRIESAAVDARVLVFTISVAIVAGVLFGIVPAWQVTGESLNADLTDGSMRASTSRRTGRARDLLIVAEVCVALVLLIGAGLLLRSFAALSRVDTGIASQNLLTFDLFLSGQKGQTQSTQAAFYHEALQTIASLPGVRSAGAAATLPIGGDTFATGVIVEGEPVAGAGQELRMGYQTVSPNYFLTMGIRVLEGRDFRDADNLGAAPVAIVNQTFARRHWPNQDAVGRRIRFGRESSTPWLTIVGVAGDVRHLGPGVPPRPEVYQPLAQRSFRNMAFVVRTSGDPRPLAVPIRKAIASLDPSQPVSRPMTMDEHIARSLSQPRFMSSLVTAFGALALLLSVVGVYGVVAYSVAERTREIAIRAALGAQWRDVMALVLGKALRLSIAGVTLGLAAAFWLTRALAGLLYGVSASDPITYIAVAVLLIAVALCAGAVPAWRAVRIAAVTALRSV